MYAVGFSLGAVWERLRALAADGYVGKGEVFMLRVVGDSMVDAGIRDGDHVVVRSQDDADPGSVVAAPVLGEAPDAVELTLKRLAVRDGRRVLLPANPAYQPIVLHDGDRIVGAVVTVLRDLHGDAARVALQELQEMSGSLP